MVMDEPGRAQEPRTPLNAVDTVVCLHGIWSHGAGMYLIKRHLEREYGMQALLFTYPSVTGTLDENADLLRRFIEENELESAHIVGHSLGGVVALRMFANYPDAVPGRLVCLGSPLCGSRAGRFVQSLDWAEPILGHSLPEGVLENTANEWGTEVCRHRDVGVVAGRIPLGIGQISGKFKEPNDGTVAVSETMLDGARDHVVLTVSHTGMLISKNVADQAGAFLKRGHFLRDD